jgi:hypothetical protein
VLIVGIDHQLERASIIEPDSARIWQLHLVIKGQYFLLHVLGGFFAAVFCRLKNQSGQLQQRWEGLVRLHLLDCTQTIQPSACESLR